MLKTKLNKVLVVFVINLIIALGFFIDNLDTQYSSLSSDIQNIIPVAQKFDNPDLFKYDLYLNDLNNVRYYTPFYVQSLRGLAQLTEQDYVQAINLMNLICQLLFGVLWFLLIYKFVAQFWVALLLSIVIRGVVWLPGLELWGISDLWAMMPRTLYITLFPIPFLVLSSSVNRLLISAFLIGLLFNFHPITGLGGILLFLSFVCLYVWYFEDYKIKLLKTGLLMCLAIGLGMLPFILTYFGKTSTAINYDMQVFNEAFNSRIPAFFTQPLLFLKQWLNFKTLFYIIPILLYFIISRSDKIAHKQSKLILLLTVILVALPSVSVYVERLINELFNLNLRLSFQLIRAQKVAIIPAFIAMAYLLKYAHDRYAKPYLLPGLTGLFLLVLLLAKAPVFNEVPFIGDDICRRILPNNLSFGAIKVQKTLAVDKMAEYIANNTAMDAVIYGSHHYRGASKRSVLLDSKGGSMVIEGDPIRFILWKQQQKQFAAAKTAQEQIDFLRAIGVNYIVTRSKTYDLELLHIEKDLKLYKL